MATNFSPCKGSYVLNQFPSNVMFGMNGFHVSASGAIQGHHGPLVFHKSIKPFFPKAWLFIISPQFDINSFLIDDDTRNFCGQCRSRSDCTDYAL